MPMHRYLGSGVAFVLLLLPASTLGDSLHLESVPATPPRQESFLVKATGEANPGTTIEVGNPADEKATCPPSRPPYGFLNERTVKTWPVAGVFEHTFSYSTLEGAGSPFCGYIYSRTDMGGTEIFTTTAFAELVVAYGPGKAEREIEERRNHEHEEAVRLEGQAVAERAAEKKASEERQATERYEAEAPARKAAEEEAARAHIDAELSRERALAHKKPIKHLSVRPEARQSRSSQAPGETVLDITTDPFAYVTVKLTRYGHSTLHLEWLDFTRGEDVIPWSCHSPGSEYKYVVTARSGVGPSLTRRGRFSPVSMSRCRTLKREEAEARERRERKYAEERQSEERKFDQEVEEKEDNCRKMGDRVVPIHSPEGPRWVCVTPGGIDVEVPY